MGAEMLQISVERRDPATVVSIEGELDIASAASFASAIEDAEATAPEMLVFDLTRLRFIDSTGLRLILGADARARAGGRRVALVKGPPTVHRVFMVALLDKRLEFLEDAPPAGG